MATVVLQTVGAAIGGAIAGPFGAVLGRAAGAAAGYAIDQSFLAKDQVVQGPRLDSTRILTANEGAPIPKVYGRNRISGQVIWATRFEEVESTTTSGGKGTGGKSSSTTFSYFGNFAIGLCEGEVSTLGRVWADGKEIDLTKIEYRFYKGDEDQVTDPLIEAKQGLGNAPAYRGIAYIVFESFPLADYGNRIPQFTFEIIRGIGKLEEQIKSITVIPGSTEFGYDTKLITNGGASETYSAHNRNNLIAQTDWIASIDELQALCPNLQSVSLVIAWFGNDLRASNCKIRPGVTSRIGSLWQVNNLRRHEAYLVSQIDGRAAFGGTPNDASLLRAIQDLKSRGLKVVLYPFIMMDIPDGNTLPDLSGIGTQPTYPWRGEISCFPKPGVENSADKTDAARLQLNAFEVEYKNFIQHYANLAKQAGGIDGFLIGSELRSLTRVRDGAGKFPFVETLISIASDSKQIMGAETQVIYSADWSEYFGYQPQDGSGDVLFNLDDLWSSPNIDAIGIDNYMPLADWRDEDYSAQRQDRSPYNIQSLKNNIAAEEGFDWFYASQADRLNQIKTPITDGFGEPWIYRYKDLRSWWSNEHHNRLGGEREKSPTSWVPQSKPIYFTELGCPAVDKGANQPNVFYDPKSTQSALPYFSSGGQDDLIQRRYLEAHYEFWQEGENNPISQIYNAPMVTPEALTPWAWDARPFPFFPVSLETWSDGDNWQFGHWLNGRLGGCSLQDLVYAILKDFGYSNFEVQLDGIVDGYLIPAQTSARGALEPLLQLYNIQTLEEDGLLKIRNKAYADLVQLDAANLVQEDDQPKLITKRINDLELPAEAAFAHATVFGEYEETITKSRRLEGASDRQISLQAPITMSKEAALNLAEKRLRQDWVGRLETSVSLSYKTLFISAGDCIEFSDQPGRSWKVNTIERGLAQTVTLQSSSEFPSISASKIQTPSINISPVFYGQPEALLLDLPLLKSSDQNKLITHVAISALPWAGNYSAYSSFDIEGFSNRASVETQATIGTLLQPLEKGSLGIWDRKNELTVSLINGSFESVSELALLNGANVIAVEALNGSFEVLQFASANLQNDGTWKLSKLLRGQLGTEVEMQSTAAAGAKVVLINQALYPLEMSEVEIGSPYNWRIGPSRDLVSSDNYTSLQKTYTARSHKMFSPVHLRAMQSNDGDITLSWVRRTRIDGDSWQGSDVPLDATSELYQITILDENSSVKRQITAENSSYVYEHSLIQTDFGSAETGFTFLVSQISSSGIAGNAARQTVNIQ